MIAGLFREIADVTEPWPDHGKDARPEAVGVDDRAPAVLGRRQEGDEPIRDRAGDAAWPPAVKALYCRTSLVYTMIHGEARRGSTGRCMNDFTACGQHDRPSR
jgi:hypothetical protein